MFGMQPNLEGSVLLITAAFEQFVSDVIVEFAGNLPCIVPVYDDLPSGVRSSNERFTGEALLNRRKVFAEFDRRRLYVIFVIVMRACDRTLSMERLWRLTTVA